MLRYHKSGGGQAEVGEVNPLPTVLMDSVPTGRIEQIGTDITPKTLTAADDEIVPAPDAGNQAVLFSWAIQNTDSQAQSVTFTDGTNTWGPYEIEAGGLLAAFFWPLGTAWFGADNAAFSATPSADGVLKLTNGKYLVQASE